MLKIPPEEYYKSLPKKRCGAGILFFNGKNELLIVKPNYKEGWSIPGGVVDENESPKAAAIREAKEEIGLDVSDLKLAYIVYTAPEGIKTEAFQFLFFGGILNDTQISKIKLQEDELDEFRFVSENEVVDLLASGLKERVPECLSAIKNNTVAYKES
ncbi:MAG TPA: NUDIX hydrolase [Candidatus Paceibacterota bacterium]